MNLKEKYKNETKTDVYHENPIDAGAWCYTSDYVRWLEKQITETCDTCDYMPKCDSQKIFDGTIFNRKKCESYKPITPKK